ncbi:MAG: NACHT domain-containing protein [Scytonema sp. PMC 1069.18]|nr:NACHT domain-containing protein [Scytonema sp. PMC 1069.18]MEC4881984.1 NACHT domain-containing protein [Scytonema sp. PMC 1070.18]
MSHQQQEDKNQQLDETIYPSINDTVCGDKVGRDKFGGDQVQGDKYIINYGSPSADGKPCDLTLYDWCKVCRATFEEQNPTRLTTNLLIYPDEASFHPKNYVSLGLVEQKQRLRHRNDIRLEYESSLDVPEDQYEVDQLIQDNEFFEKVLHQGQSEESKQQMIAIIGEPGSGKTTLLQKLADWLLNSQNEIAIWISLCDLQGKKLKDYLQKVWLDAALPYISPDTAEVTLEMQDALAKLFNTRRVWLLLDGVDEINLDESNHLTAIANQLRSWVTKARVILTCRLNVWDIDRNVTAKFATYRTIGFSYGDDCIPDRVGQFISSWFQHISPNRGKELQAKLNKPGNEQIKDLVKNPLRLELLCQIWQTEEGELPKTKAELYSEFIKAIYVKKQEQFPKIQNEEQQEALNQALGQLALKAINDRQSRWLRKNFVREVLGKLDDPEGSFQLALNLGLLNRVKETEKPKEDVYAFLHATFQEYFAAQATRDWREFLHHIPDRPKQQGTYRIFEPRYKEVILLWLEQPETKVSKQQKQEFIEALVDYKDKCQGDNIFKTCTILASDCLVAADLIEHPLYVIIYKQLVQLYRRSTYRWLREQAFQALKRLNKTFLLCFLEEELNYPDKNRTLRAIKALGELGTEQAVELLASKYLKEGEEPVPIVNALISTNTDKSRSTIQKILERLAKDEERSLAPQIINLLIDTNRPEYFHLLINILTEPQTPYWLQTDILKQLGSINVLDVKEVFLRLLTQAWEENNIPEIIALLKAIKFPATEEMIPRVKHLLEYNEEYLVEAIRFLSEQHRILQDELIHLFDKNQNQEKLQQEILQALIRIQSPQAEKDAIERCQDEYAPRYLSKEWIQILGKFGSVQSLEYLSAQLHLLMNDAVGDRELEAAVILAIYQIFQRLHDNQNIDVEISLCQNIMLHLQLSCSDEDNLTEAAIYLLLTIGTTSHLTKLLEFAKEQLYISEALLRYLHKYPLKSEYEDLIQIWIDERVIIDDELTAACFHLKVHLSKTEEKKWEILMSALEGNRPLLCREALQIAYNQRQPKEILLKVENLLAYPDTWIVEKAIEILGKIGNAATLEVLLPFIKNNQYEQEGFKALYNIAERWQMLNKPEFKESIIN